jgi:predicted regulator of Ras-like GTPase activity (Roadblock/LC7/MglB family)
MNNLLLSPGIGSVVAQRLAEAMQALNQHELVESAVLSTVDGLPLEGTAARAAQLAAAAGFMLANAQQTCANLSVKDDCAEVVVRQESGRLLICRAFTVHNSRLILVVLLKRDGSYQLLINQVIQNTCAIMTTYLSEGVQ